MRRFLVLLLVTVMVVFAAPAMADAPEFPVFTPMDFGPEGIAIDNHGNVYISVGVPGEPPRTELWKYDPTGDGEVLAVLPGPPPAGLAVDANGKHVYVAQQFAGVFKVDMAGNVELVPGTNAIVVPNSLAFDKHGNLYITETLSFDGIDGFSFYENCVGSGFTGWFGRGGIWYVPKGGEAELLVRDDLLTGICAPNPIPYPVGANGLAYRHGSLIVANTEKALLLEVPVLADGVLGEISILTDVPGSSDLGPWMIDGIALDVHGNIYVAIVTGGAVVRVSPDGTEQEVVGTALDGLDFPASLAFGTGKGERKSLFVTNLALSPPEFAKPGFAKIDVGQPGMPLP
ncbi:MAG: SMP-30/gluconolactonase/LRE family protein [Acidimicrobiia bacterium]